MSPSGSLGTLRRLRLHHFLKELAIYRGGPLNLQAIQQTFSERKMVPGFVIFLTKKIVTVTDFLEL